MANKPPVILLLLVVVLLWIPFPHTTLAQTQGTGAGGAGVLRPIRSHPMLRPTRVNYSDIEKTNKTCLPKDTCAPSRNDRNGAMMNDPKRRNCNCDQQCIVYEDCCVDSPYRRDPDVNYSRNSRSGQFECVTLRQFGSLYMKSSCPISWKDLSVKHECEEDKSSSYDPISTLPVTNTRTGHTYKNYYCALCNNETFTEKMSIWTPRLECPSLSAKEIENITQEELINQLEYRPDEGRWGLSVQRGRVAVWNSCGIDPVVPQNVEYLVRYCKPSIKDCPVGYNNTDIHRKCLSYTGTVYHLQEGYRNVHCAICNGILPENLFCSPHGTSRSAFHFEFNQAAFSLLFDLNPESGTEVGKIRKCKRSTEIYDPFFQKCRSILCQPGQYYNNGKCINYVTTTTTTSTTTSSSISTRGSTSSTTTIRIPTSSEMARDRERESTTSFPFADFESCPKIILEPNEYEILDNGSIWIPEYRQVLGKDNYALQSSDRLVICSPNGATYYTDKFGAVWGYLSFVGVLISIICLIIHLVASALVPELRNLSGKNLASLSVALLVIYSIFLGMPFVQIPSESCTVMAVILYYSFMCAFCWMLVLAWDVSATLRRATQELRISTGSQWTRFIFYSIFGWLFPAILVILSVISEFVSVEGEGDETSTSTVSEHRWAYSPNFGDGTCWFGNKPALLIYFVGPVGFILLLNLILFIDSARLIASTTHGTAKAKACGPSHKNFKLYIRLALLMGLSWISGIIAGLIDIPILWIIFILLNTLQGLFIFLGFTCTSKIRKLLRTKFCCSSGSSTTGLNASWTWSGSGTGGLHPHGANGSNGGTTHHHAANHIRGPKGLLMGRSSSSSATTTTSASSLGFSSNNHLTNNNSKRNSGELGDAMHSGTYISHPSLPHPQHNHHSVSGGTNSNNNTKVYVGASSESYRV